MAIVTELDEIEDMLMHRMKRAEEVAQAVISATTSVHAEQMLAHAKADTEVWATRSSGPQLGSQFTPLQVQAIVAERNN
ncbi:hypothetical protein M3M33_15220, partial [Loigolactobacillus coryniformis]|uniref:hypothetical protein n=1 Tax=Loigolactobacillus coryniformis TaxID=1610 RepID=UPI00201B20F4